MTGSSPEQKSRSVSFTAENAPPLNTAALTWAGLLGAWVDYARSAVAYPDSASGQRMRDSVPDVIQLQAVWFALMQLSDLPPPQQALGLDRAAVLIERHAGILQQRFASEPMPSLMKELIEDAQTLLAERQAGRTGEP